MLARTLAYSIFARKRFKLTISYVPMSQFLFAGFISACHHRGGHRHGHHHHHGGGHHHHHGDGHHHHHGDGHHHHYGDGHHHHHGNDHDHHGHDHHRDGQNGRGSNHRLSLQKLGGQGDNSGEKDVECPLSFGECVGDGKKQLMCGLLAEWR